MVPPMRRMPVTSLGVNLRQRSGSISPSKLSSRPITSHLQLDADLTTARITALSPGASPPPVMIPIRFTPARPRDEDIEKVYVAWTLSIAAEPPARQRAD